MIPDRFIGVKGEEIEATVTLVAPNFICVSDLFGPSATPGITAVSVINTTVMLDGCVGYKFNIKYTDLEPLMSKAAKLELNSFQIDRRS